MDIIYKWMTQSSGIAGITFKVTQRNEWPPEIFPQGIYLCTVLFSLCYLTVAIYDFLRTVTLSLQASISCQHWEHHCFCKGQFLLWNTSNHFQFFTFDKLLLMKTVWRKSTLLQWTGVHCTLRISDKGKKETSLHCSRSDNTIDMTMKRRKQWIGRSNMEDIIYFCYLLWEIWILVLLNSSQKPMMGWAVVLALPSLLFSSL